MDLGGLSRAKRQLNVRFASDCQREINGFIFSNGGHTLGNILIHYRNSITLPLL